MRRWLLALALAGCTSPLSRPVDIDAGGGQDLAAAVDQVPGQGAELGRVAEAGPPDAGDEAIDSAVIPAPVDSRLPDLAPEGPPAPDAAEPDKPPGPDKPPPPPIPEPPPPPPPAKKCVDCGADCWPPLICVVAGGGLPELGKVPVAPFCMVAKGGSTSSGAAIWEIAGPDGTCDGFFSRFHLQACTQTRPGFRYEQRERHYDLRGELASETGGEVVLSCP